MSFFLRSNCHLKAWEKFRENEAEWMCIRFTLHSRVTWTAKWWWAPMRATGLILQWVAWPITHLGEMLRSGRWYHASWIKWDREHLEFVPFTAKRKRLLPPLLFHGQTKKVNIKE